VPRAGEGGEDGEERGSVLGMEMDVVLKELEMDVVLKELRAEMAVVLKLRVVTGVVSKELRVVLAW